jgi:CubicO group peptidase (beta-lactamase class C family)
LIDFEATVGSYIPSFNKGFEVITEPTGGETEIMEIPYTSFMTGKTTNLSYCKKVAKNRILVKHCLAESAGIGYDMWTDFDLAFDQPIFGHQYGVAQALRRKNGIGYYTSNTIIGQNATLEEYCDAIASSGYLVSEPGTFSYGLGALILGRIIEVVLEKETGKFLRFSEICNEKLFKPLRMNSAAFYLDDGDPRISKVPQLYGAVLNDETQGLEVKPYSECYQS